MLAFVSCNTSSSNKAKIGNECKMRNLLCCKAGDDVHLLHRSAQHHPSMTAKGFKAFTLET